MDYCLQPLFIISSLITEGNVSNKTNVPIYIVRMQPFDPRSDHSEFIAFWWLLETIRSVHLRSSNFNSTTETKRLVRTWSYIVHEQ